MTVPARISQADMMRAIRAVKAAGVKQASVVMDLVQQRITIIVGEGSTAADEANPFDEEWADDDL